MKKFAIIFTLICFSTNVVAEVIIMKCKKYRYKYLSNEGVVTIYSANIKRDKKIIINFAQQKLMIVTSILPNQLKA